MQRTDLTFQFRDPRLPSVLPFLSSSLFVFFSLSISRVWRTHQSRRKEVHIFHRSRRTSRPTRAVVPRGADVPSLDAESFFCAVSTDLADCLSGSALCFGQRRPGGDQMERRSGEHRLVTTTGGRLTRRLLCFLVKECVRGATEGYNNVSHSFCGLFMRTEPLKLLFELDVLLGILNLCLPPEHVFIKGAEGVVCVCVGVILRE